MTKEELFKEIEGRLKRGLRSKNKFAKEDAIQDGIVAVLLMIQDHELNNDYKIRGIDFYYEKAQNVAYTSLLKHKRDADRFTSVDSDSLEISGFHKRLVRCGNN